eukprot:Unigene5138_Nuclearia_a/m.15772 Unigene5138_Nuclearia_a/g.15772  ORF Unigene5138_Nuclearia_a/g.15772 Unigene5138_Nuclearia_a/m.15772 type:complete len:420 (-) Unigene5138_Nuclearia_a:83-1342(-)
MMARAALGIALVAALALAAAARRPQAAAHNQYVVQLVPGVDVDEHLAALGLSHENGPHQQHLHAGAPGGDQPRVRAVYRRAINGYALQCSDSFLLAVRARGEREVLRVEPDVFVGFDGDAPARPDAAPTPDAADVDRTEQRNPPSWGLDRIDQALQPLDQLFRYPDVAGADVDVYSLDTGVDVEHPDFGGRAVWGKTIVAGSADADGNGHGTSTAAIAVGTSFGVAKRANVIAVKVFNDGGFGSTADLIAGLDYVIASAEAHKPNRAVAMMALGGSKSPALESAVQTAVEADIVVAAAAGSSATDACNFSPGGSPLVLTVAATDASDSYAGTSNGGPCVKLAAPGVLVTTARPGGGNTTITGSSFGCAHAAGAAAIALSLHRDYSPAQIEQLLIDQSTKDVLRNVPANTANRLLLVHPA